MPSLVYGLPLLARCYVSDRPGPLRRIAKGVADEISALAFYLPTPRARG